MSSTPTISSYAEPCSRHRWEVPDGHNIAARVVASCHTIGRVWALDGSQGM